LAVPLVGGETQEIDEREPHVRGPGELRRSEVADDLSAAALDGTGHATRVGLEIGELGGVQRDARPSTRNASIQPEASRLAADARAIEGLMTVATIPSNGWPPHHHVAPALREARMCYDHMAGRLGVAVCDVLLRRHHVVLVDGGGEVTPTGERFLAGLGVDLPKARGTQRHYCRGCIDWTERRHPLSGAVRAAPAEAFLARRLVTRLP